MQIDWSKVNRVLVVKLRSIGDTVLTTPSLIALRRFLPDAQIDILLEDWVAPVLEGFDAVDNVIVIGKGTGSRLKTARELRGRKYDVVINQHGGTTATLLAYATGAKHRVGYAHYQYAFLHNHLPSSASDFWRRPKNHSAEQQLALVGSVGVPVEDKPKSKLAVTDAAIRSLETKVSATRGGRWFNETIYALIHPAAAFATKQWAVENFARTVEFLAEKGIASVAVAAKHEAFVLEALKQHSTAPVIAFDDLTLSEITAVASNARLFVGNDSGIAHIAAAVNTPSVVVFGSSNRDHWRPWTDAPNEIVFEEFSCQPCPGYTCEVFGEPKCILTVKPEAVFSAIERVLS